MTAVQKANLIDDWARSLAGLQFVFVDAAFIDWLNDHKNLDDKGRMVKPGIAQIRRMASDAQQIAELRTQPLLPPKEIGPDDYGKIAPQHDGPKFGGLLGSRYTHDDYYAWYEQRRAWFESPNYPFPLGQGPGA